MGTQHWQTTYHNTLSAPKGPSPVERAEWTKHQKPYYVHGSGAQSEYKTIFGKFGSQIEVVKDRQHQREIMLDNELKLGNQKNRGFFIKDIFLFFRNWLDVLTCSQILRVYSQCQNLYSRIRIISRRKN